jgi:hypothetical protein
VESSSILFIITNFSFLRWKKEQDTFLKSVELIKATPGTALAESDKDAAHGLEIESLVATEHEHEAPELRAKGFHGLRLSGTCRSEWVSSQTYVKRLFTL